MEEEIRNQNSPETLIQELQRLRVASRAKIILVGRMPNGKIAFLETGNTCAKGSGLAHIVERYLQSFNGSGISAADVPDLILEAVTKGRSILKQGTRDVFEVDFRGEIRYIAITVSDNGYIVGANPVGRRSLAKIQRQQERRDA